MEYSFQQKQAQERSGKSMEVSKKGEQEGEEQQASTIKNDVIQVVAIRAFQYSNDQVIFNSDDLNLSATSKSFTVAFTFVCYNDEPSKSSKQHKADQEYQKSSLQIDEFKHIVQLGNRGIKFLTASIDQKTNLLCIAYRRDLNQEYLYSQSKIKPLEINHLQIVYDQSTQGESISYCFSLFLNGVLQGQINMMEEINVPHKYHIFVGSESALGLFTGVVSDLIIGGQALGIEMIKLVNDQKRKKQKEMITSTKEELKYLDALPCIVDIVNEIQNKQEMVKHNNVISMQIKHLVPVSVAAAHESEAIDQAFEQQIEKNSQPNKALPSKNKNYAEEFKSCLLRNKNLMLAMRQLSLNYRWIFVTLQAMSPPIEEGIGSKLSFFSIHSLISTGNIQVNHSFPLYIIESTRFHRTLSYSQIEISKEQLEYLAEKAGCLKRFTYEQALEGNINQKLKIDCIKYDRFMQMARDMSLSTEEIIQVKELTKINPLQEELDRENEKKEWTMVQNEFIKDNSKPMFVYSSISHLQRVLKQKQIPDALKESSSYSLIGLYLILPPFRSLADTTYYNRFVKSLFEFRYSNGIDDLFKSICPGKLNRCQFSIFTEFVTQKLSLEASPAIEEIFKMLCIINPTYFGQQEFSQFLSNWCLGAIYEHKANKSIISVDCFTPKYLEIQNQQNLQQKQQLDSSQLPTSDQQVSDQTYFQFKVVVQQEGETIQGICGTEKDGFLQLQSLKVITTKRKIRLAPLRDHKQFQNQIFQDVKSVQSHPERMSKFNFSPWENNPQKLGQNSTGTGSINASGNTQSNSIQQQQPQNSSYADGPEEATSFKSNSNMTAEAALATLKYKKKSKTLYVPNNYQSVLSLDNDEEQKEEIKKQKPKVIQQKLQAYLEPSLKQDTSSMSISNREIRMEKQNIPKQLEDEDNITLFFDPQERKKVSGFEILINQDHEIPIKYPEEQMMMNISSQKYICRFSSLKLLSSNHQRHNSQTGTPLRTPPLSPMQQAKQIFSSEGYPTPSRPTTSANSQHGDYTPSHINNQASTPLSAAGSNTMVSAPLTNSAFKYTNIENYPVFYNSWNLGKFQIIINHCSQCDSHQMSTSHEEADFCEKFNELGLALSNTFPNIEIIGNYERPPILESFEVYIRGVGPANMRDNQGRIWLYKKGEPTKFFLAYFEQRILKVYDGLVLLSQSYGGSLGLEQIQNQYLKKYENLIPQISMSSHDYPCEIPDRIKQIEEEKKREIEVFKGTIMICKNWGCGKTYEYSDDPNSNKQCLYHPKPFDLGSMHGLWPESWSCCRGEWKSKGCIRGRHNGQPEKKFQKLCVNHGEINPESKHPDSACGQLFIENKYTLCRYHRGYFKILSKDNGYWTCCNDGSILAIGCRDDNHEAVSWPDERSKIYFVNPGIDKNPRPSTFDKTSLQSAIYRVTEQYKPYVTRKTQLQQERKANENEIRICLNWGCEEKNMRFKEIDNTKDQERHFKNCSYHPGYFDFGNVNKPGEGVISIHQQLQNEEENKIHANSIRPHWTCCRREWKAVGCKLTYHWGPVEATMAELKHGRWPDINSMKYFKKQASSNFKQKMGELVLNEEIAKHYWYQFSVGKELIPIERIGELCDKFKLSWMALSEDLSYHFKYFDILKGIAQKYLDNGNGMVERQRFTEWWLQPLDKYPINF